MQSFLLTVAGMSLASWLIIGPNSNDEQCGVVLTIARISLKCFANLGI